jgi:rhodanese-related sulfurtransferase
MDIHEPVVPEVSPEEVKHAIDEKQQCVLLDVRTLGEYSRGHIAGSMHIPVDEIQNTVVTRIPDVSTRIYVYCLSGNRSANAVSEMIRMGYTNVFSMQYGLLGWRAKYFPVQSE